jgi:hypothetical protein
MNISRQRYCDRAIPIIRPILILISAAIPINHLFRPELPKERENLCVYPCAWFRFCIPNRKKVHVLIFVFISDCYCKSSKLYLKSEVLKKF